MNDTKQPTTSSPKQLDAYQKQELELSKMILDTLQNSTELAESVNLATEAKEKKERITRELAQLKSNKVELEEKIENLEKNFGELDSLGDIRKLNGLKIELESVSMGIPILEKKLNSDSDISLAVRDIKDNVGLEVRQALKPLGVHLQDHIDEKVKDIILTFDMFQNAIDRVRKEQEIMPREYLRFDIFRSIIPNINELEHLVEDEFAGMALAARVFRLGNQPAS